MSDSHKPPPLIRFGIFELDTTAEELRRSGRLVALTGQPLRVLAYLAERPGEVISREDMQRAIWGEDTHVDFEAGLSTCINQIRAALGDRATSPRFIETLPRRGYRFIAPVEARATVSATRRSTWVAVGIVVVLAGIAWWSFTPARPIPVAVFAVDVDASTPQLQPVSVSLTHALIGTLTSQLGARGRVASSIETQQLADVPLHEILRRGTEYVLLVTLRSAGGSVLVHVKLVDRTGAVSWASDRVMRLDELEREQLTIATEVSKQVATRITRG
jgi:DNA-binding winged helix-turn-helix (wHTH) protein/TolB-like protein